MMAEFEIEESEIQLIEIRRSVGIQFGEDTLFVRAPMIFVEWQSLDGEPSMNVELPRDVQPSDIPALIAALQRAQEIAEQWAAEAESEVQP